MYFYILEPDRSITSTDDPLRWAIWFQASSLDGSRIIERSELAGYEVLTAFLGVSLGVLGDIPLTFQSTVLRGSRSLETHLYVTQDEAEAGHQRLVAKYRKFVSYVPG
jgi:sporulation protein YlmC with PRC-barrel domain